VKAILEFTLPEDTEEFGHASRGADYHRRLGDVRQWLRQRVKHGDFPDDYTVAINDFWDAFHTLTEGLDL